MKRRVLQAAAAVTAMTGILTCSSKRNIEYRKAIDVSSCQGYIDWDVVKKEGIDYAVIRCGSTDMETPQYYRDRYFLTNYYKAREAGVNVSAYMYTVACTKNEMKDNVERMMHTLAETDITVPVFLDIESEDIQGKLKREELTEIALYGCSLLEEKGYRAGIYSSSSFLWNHLNPYRIKSHGYNIWIASYPEEEYVDPTDYSKYDLWQFTDNATVKGIEGDVDMSYIYNFGCF